MKDKEKKINPRKFRHYEPSGSRWCYLRVASIAEAINEPMRANNTTKKQQALLDSIQAEIIKHIENYERRKQTSGNAKAADNIGAETIDANKCGKAGNIKKDIEPEPATSVDFL